MPQMDGFEVCRQIRKSSPTDSKIRSDIPIIMLTARGDVTDRVVGLELGADDYLSKPFEPRELVARIQNVLRRTIAKPRSSRMEFNELSIDSATRTVCVENRELELTTMEYQLLVMLAESPGKNFTRDEILNVLKGTDAELMTRSVDILVSRLRQKLKPSEPIRTVWGSGYAFVAKSDT
jgi:DNA-binding response OmpR family regulator